MTKSPQPSAAQPQNTAASAQCIPSPWLHPVQLAKTTRLPKKSEARCKNAFTKRCISQLRFAHPTLPATSYHASWNQQTSKYYRASQHSIFSCPLFARRQALPTMSLRSKLSATIRNEPLKCCHTRALHPRPAFARHPVHAPRDKFPANTSAAYHPRAASLWHSDKTIP